MDYKKKCPCCEYKTLDINSDFQICPVCFWEDDPLQRKFPDYAGGANEPSLIEAKQNFKEIGAIEKSLIKYVRKPNSMEK